MHYAAQFCQLTGAELELVYIKPVWQQLLLLGTGNGPLVNEHDPELMDKELKQLCIELHYKYNIRCAYDIQHATLAASDVLQQKCGPGTMVIAGTNGADRFVQRIFGSITFRIARDLDAPVLIIPEGVEFSPIRQIAFAWDYHAEEFCLDCLEQYAEELGSKLVFLHVSTHESQISRDVFRALTTSVQDKMKSKVEVEFSRIYASQLRPALDEYLKEHHGSLLAVSYRNGKLLRKFFRREGSASTLFMHPVLILHTGE
jgi:hypothetical protein